MRAYAALLFILPLLLLVSCGDDKGTTPIPGTPSISSIVPAEVSRGQKNVSGTITGSNLNGVSSANLGNGITVNEVRGLSNTAVSVDFSVGNSAAAGPRDVTVTTSGGTATRAGALNVLNNIAPKASFRIEPPTFSPKVVITFDASGSEDPKALSLSASTLKYSWDFGDGKTDHGRITEHQYSSVGNYTASLTVEDNRGATNTATKRLEVTENAAPVPLFTVSPDVEGTTKTEFEFSASRSYDPDGRITEYTWDFGDGSKKKHGESTTHTYKKGTFNVTLTVTDNHAQENADSKRLTVEESKEIVCTRYAPNRGLIFGTVVGVEGHTAIVRLPKGSTCGNSFYHCGDFRKAEPENFYGIIKKMSDLGDGTFSIFNDCPYRWPPTIGEKVFLYWKTCGQNYCP